MSSGNVWLACLSVTVTLVTGVVTPATVMFDGYAAAGPDVPVPGTRMAVAFEKVWDVCLTIPSVVPTKQRIWELIAGTVSAATQKRAAPVCWMPIRKRTSTEAPAASGVPSVTAPTDNVPA